MSPNLDEKKIQELIENWAKSIRDKNMDGIVANHTDDIIMFDVPFPLQSKGMDEYKKTWDLFFKYSPGGEGSFNLVDLKIAAGDKTAFAHSLLIINNEKNPDCRLTIGLKKIRGRWLITHEHHSAPHKLE
jgi:ketosteroid isomerase-like protein